MLSQIWARCEKFMVLPVFAVILSGAPVSAQIAGHSAAQQDHAPVGLLHWESPAHMRRADLISTSRGTLLIDNNGVEFRVPNGRRRRWAFGEIRTLLIAPRRLVLETYINRSLHRPGQREYKFELAQTLPPSVAAAIAEAVARPSRNADPDPDTPAIATIPVRHRTFSSGTNGVLRFWQGGIDYVTATRGDSRSWRWSDLQTLSDPDPYHLFVFGYRDTYTFDLKARVSRKLLDWASDEMFRHNGFEDAAAGTSPGVASMAGDRP